MRPAIRPAPLHLAVIALFMLVAHAAAAASSTMPSIVVDVESGRVLHAQREFDRWQPASLTKLMTAYVAFREIESGALTLKSPVRISSNAARKPPSHMAYPVGTIVNLDNALKMLLAKSANDIAVAIAESVSGSEAEFAKRMNAEAARLGMNDSHFVNPHGLHADGQVSSAHDLAVLARAIRREFPQYDRYFSIEALQAGERTYSSYNLLLGRFPGADGMKTGYICESGFNLVGSATRDGHTLIAVVLGEMSSKSRAERAADLLELGFSRLPMLDSLPLLASLAPPADRTTEVADLRATVCSQEANDARWADRSLDHFATDALTPMTRAPVPVAVFTGGAEGISKSAVLFAGQYFDSLPVPAVRPMRLSDEVAERREQAGLVEGMIPVPQSRPDGGA
ncbi:D-alanyl-D-alanine carboxypeptidase family protein [Oricola thermophila]|uniref:D-alanyl-D-alanine carboxypeptidase n=1 Tax=Oricola thermophila TaxID=2742145 RepID=A0A6N1VGV8_9HYPH|nr:D-alanyl-D-alanine carboxypeptidase family protein [Oricola thermophila]QKV20156.1 D-alanyl-D-alanine carboxypeptidase [Oricola thermophila]